MKTVASESVVVLLCRRFSRTASSSAVSSTSFPFTSSSFLLPGGAASPGALLFTPELGNDSTNPHSHKA
ncbi:hypothetical protein OPV22_024443 [Ensete ventricosum]|uniref:Secreted protein n=1 Tax=Ensete ventricosum TaxID=4639 RepID=A0AAV8P7E4_ENSVE|nr:hypothetical protein OPV22_024443 [Ensete ventricosum]